MKTEKSIIVCDQEVRMRYCAATETIFEKMKGYAASVFVPAFGKNDNGEVVITEPAKATTEDYLYLGIAAIEAAYERDGKDAPIKKEDVLYEASPSEISEMLTTVILLRNEWYKVPEVVKPEIEAKDDVPN